MTVPHFPLFILGMYMGTIGAFIRTPIPGVILAILVFVAWIPTLYVRAMQHLTDVSTVKAAALMVGPYALWLAVIGRYLWQQLNHLL